MTKPLKRKTMTFVVRIWAEYLQRDPPVYRGELEHVESRQKSYFQSADELKDLVASYCRHAVENSELPKQTRV